MKIFISHNKLDVIKLQEAVNVLAAAIKIEERVCEKKPRKRSSGGLGFLFNLRRLKKLEREMKKLKARLKEHIQRFYFDRKPTILMFKVIVNTVTMGNEDENVYFINHDLKGSKHLNYSLCQTRI